MFLVIHDDGTKGGRYDNPRGAAAEAAARNMHDGSGWGIEGFEDTHFYAPYELVLDTYGALYDSSNC